MRTVATWLAANWKPLISMLAAVTVAGWGAVSDIKAEISDNTDAIEQLDDSHMRELGLTNARINTIEADVQDVRCILVAELEGRNPLSCLNSPRR